MARRVLIFMIDPNWGGPHNIVAQVAPGLLREGYELVVAFSQDRGNAEARYQDTGVEIHRVPVHRIRRYGSRLKNVLGNLVNLAGMASDVRHLRRLIRSSDIDIVQVSGVMAIQAGIAAWLERKPIVWQILGLVTPKPIMAVYMPFIVSVSAAIMSVGKIVAAQHYHVAKRARHLVYFIPPVDVDRFAPDRRDRDATRALLGIASGDFLVGVVGNRNPAKAHEYFVQIAAQCRDRALPFKFAVVGHVTAGSAEYYEDKVIDLARQKNLLQERVLTFIEPDRGIESYMRAFDAFVLTSRTEGMPTVLLEAMSTGLPSITYNVGSVSEIVTDRVGRIVDIGEIDRVCDSLKDYWSNPELARKTGEEARALAKRGFGIENCVERHVEAYARALEKARTRGPNLEAP